MSKNLKVIISILIFVILSCSLYAFIEKTKLTENPPIAGVVNTKIAAEEAVVYVSGAVNKPGVFKLSPGSRVLDAVNIAGGFTKRADSEKINLAQIVTDGQQINVAAKTLQPAHIQLTNSPPEQSGKDKLININTASDQQLQELPGIGPSMAKRIIEYRTDNGPFEEISELRRVSGIGDARFNDLKNKITL